jgi:hypothetical protein
MGRFDQHPLQMLVALLGDRCALTVVSRTILASTQSAITDGLLEGGKAAHLTDFQRPGQCRDRTHGGNSHEVFHPFRQERITLQ